MSDKTTQSGKSQKQPFDKNHPYHPDYTGDNPRGIPSSKETEDAPDRPSSSEQQHEQNQRTEQQLKQQQREQNERSAFQKGNAQEHQQGNKQR